MGWITSIGVTWTHGNLPPGRRPSSLPTSRVQPATGKPALNRCAPPWPSTTTSWARLSMLTAAVLTDRGEGDSFFAAFGQGSDAVAAACEAQPRLWAESWPEQAPIRVRLAIHTGEAGLDYRGPGRQPLRQASLDRPRGAGSAVGGRGRAGADQAARRSCGRRPRAAPAAWPDSPGAGGPADPPHPPRPPSP